MRTSGAEPTEVGMVGVSAESAVHYTARQALCHAHTRHPHVFAYRLLDWSYRDAYIAHGAPLPRPGARRGLVCSNRRQADALVVLCKELRDALASPR